MYGVKIESSEGKVGKNWHHVDVDSIKIKLNLK